MGSKPDRCPVLANAPPVKSAVTAPAPKVEEEQISFFMPGTHPAVERLKSLDLMEVTPSQAIRILEELKEIIND